jgi:hypothetical protein
VKKPDVIQKNEGYFCNQGSSIIQNQLSISYREVCDLLAFTDWGNVFLPRRAITNLLNNDSLPVIRSLPVGKLN